VVTTQWADLQKIGDRGELTVQFRTNEGLYASGWVLFTPKKWKGRSAVAEDRGPKISCGVSHSADYQKDRVVLKVPRKCLSGPKWIKVIVGSTWVVDDQGYDDNVHNTEAFAKWSARIRRG
jgi:hypothetical protein